MQKASWARAASVPECLAVLNGPGKKLELDEVDFEAELPSGEMKSKLVSSLARNHSCTSLSFHRTILSDAVLQAFSSVLLSNTTLRVLFFKQCAIGDHNLHILCHGLIRNKTVTELQLWDNNIGADGARSLAAVLRSNPALKRLNLNYNSLRDDGAGHLAAALETSHTLVSLDLFDNGIGDDGARLLAAALRGSRSLVELDLGGNLIHERIVQDFFDALRISQRLIYLNVQPNASHAHMQRRITRVCSLRTRHISHAVSAAIAANKAAPWSQARVLILGARSAGKTATVRSLMDLPFLPSPEPHNLLSTHAVASSGHRWIKSAHAQANAFTARLAARILLRESPGQGEQEMEQQRKSRRPSAFKHLLHNPLKATLRPATKVKVVEEKEEKELSSAEVSMAKQVARVLGEAKDMVSISVWDVAPQHELYHLYLTSCAVYVVVVNLLESLENIRATLASWEKTLAGNVRDGSGMIVVGTHAASADPRQVEEVSRLCGGAFHAVDNGTGEGIAELRVTVDVAVREEPLTKMPISLRWTRCLDAMMETDASWMQLADVREVGERFGIDPGEETRRMLGHFHALGLVLYLTCSQVVEDVVILNPGWLVHSVESILKGGSGDPRLVKRYGLEADVDIYKRKGIASKDLLDFLLEDEQTEFVIDLMRSLLLLSEYRFGSEEQYLVPAMVSRLPVAPAPSLAFRIELDFSTHFLPPGFFERLVCLCVQESAREPVLHKGCCTIYVGEDAAECVVEKREDEELVVVGVHEADPCPHIFAMITSFTRKIKQDFAGKNLTWEVRLSSDTAPQGVVDVQEAKQRCLTPWFEAGHAPTGDGPFAAKSMEKMDSFMGI